MIINNKTTNTKLVTKKECICINPVVKEKSFNENIELDYDKVGHIYKYNGKQLESVTEYLKKFYSKFKLEIIAKTCAKNWGVEPQAIIDLWDSNKESTSLFGTAIHSSLEHYEKFEHLGEVISKIRENKENYALPKHPLLKSIIQEFININPIKGQVITEVLITDVENGMGGRADRIVVLDRAKKVCRIGDYKINVESDKIDRNLKPLAPFNTLPANKITKYQIQMSIYANMLQKAGWTVEGLDIYIYEDGWKYYAMPVIKVLTIS